MRARLLLSHGSVRLAGRLALPIGMRLAGRLALTIGMRQAFREGEAPAEPR